MSFAPVDLEKVRAAVPRASASFLRLNGLTAEFAPPSPKLDIYRNAAGQPVAVPAPAKRKKKPHAPTDCKISDPLLESNEAQPLGATVQRKEESLRRIVVRFIGYRVQPCDPDNFAASVKDLLDGLRHAGLIHGDEPWKIRLETEQVKVAHYSDEKTVVEIE